MDGHRHLQAASGIVPAAGDSGSFILIMSMMIDDIADWLDSDDLDIDYIHDLDRRFGSRSISTDHLQTDCDRSSHRERFGLSMCVCAHAAGARNSHEILIITEPLFRIVVHFVWGTGLALDRGLFDVSYQLDRLMEA